MAIRVVRRWSRWISALGLWLGFAAGCVVAQPPESKKYALLIGINKYLGGGLQGVTPLRFADKDARALDEALDERGWDTKTVVEEGATRSRILRELYDLALVAKPNDKVLIYFAGHGVRDPLNDGRTYWLTYGANLSSLVADGIRLNHILEYVRDIPAGEKIVLLDHCYSGDIAREVAVPDPGPGPASEPGSRGPVGEAVLDNDVASRALVPTDLAGLDESIEERMVILGAARQGFAYEDEAWGHGMFTRAILDVLEDPAADTSNDRKISLSEFWLHVQAKMAAMAAAKGLRQEPFGTRITAEQIGWPLFDVLVDAGSETLELEGVLTRLDVEVGLDLQVLLACSGVLDDWREREESGLAQDSDAERVVRKLRQIRDHIEEHGVGAADDLKESLENLVRGLGLT